MVSPQKVSHANNSFVASRIAPGGLYKDKRLADCRKGTARQHSRTGCGHERFAKGFNYRAL
jgi:hypothetical protein